MPIEGRYRAVIRQAGPNKKVPPGAFRYCFGNPRIGFWSREQWPLKFFPLGESFVREYCTWLAVKHHWYRPYCDCDCDCCGRNKENKWEMVAAVLVVAVVPRMGVWLNTWLFPHYLFAAQWQICVYRCGVCSKGIGIGIDSTGIVLILPRWLGGSIGNPICICLCVDSKWIS